jgi:glycosyltransferase involved in cell wall biosynthesis
MRIVHLVLAPRLSGAEVLAKELALHQHSGGETVALAALLPQHHDFASLRAELDAAGVACLFPAQRHGALGKLWHLYGVLGRFRPDVVFAHATIPALYARVLPLAAPVVYVMHSASNDFENRRLQRVERLLSHRARAVIAVSPANVADYLGAIGAHPAISLIPNGVDPARFRAPAAAPPLPSQSLIVQVGRYNAIKNQLQTVRAFQQVAARVPAARLLLCGVIEDRAYYAAVSRLAQQLGLAERVVLDGPRADIAPLLAQASVFAMPSQSEGHSIAFLEALASGVPVVASAIAPFAFAAGFAGVQLLDTGDVPAYAQALQQALGSARCHRPLAGLTLQDTARQYLAVAHQVMRESAA